MLIYAADDERLMLEMLTESIREAAPNDELVSFRNPAQLLEAVSKRPCDVVFTDIMMPGIDGLALAKQLNEIKKDINIVFVTGYKEYAVDALGMFASGYILKPVSAEKVAEQLKHLRYPIVPKKMLKVVVDDAMDISVNGTQVLFKRRKTYELLAYLLYCRGRPAESSEIRSMLFGDFSSAVDQSNSYFTHIKRDLIETFTDLGIEEVLNFRRKRDYSLNMDLIETDPIGQAFSNAIMNQYKWITD